MLETIKKLIWNKNTAHVNCGNGELTVKLAQYAKNIAGFEYNEELLKEAMKNNPNMTYFHRNPLNELDFGNIDVCIANLDLGNIERDKITENCIKTLNEHGVFIGIINKKNYDDGYDVKFKDKFNRFIISEYNDYYLIVGYKQPIVSVIIPTYNNAKYLKESLDSVFNQTYKTLEVIVIDDCSTDNTKEILNKYPGIHLLMNSENKGIGFNRKFGINASTGDYICFLSADDRYCPEFIEESMKSYVPDTFSYSDYFFINEEGKRTHIFDTGNFVNNNAFIVAVVQTAELYSMFVNYDTIFASRKLWIENNFDENLRYGEDYEHLLKAALIKMIKFKCIKKPLIEYRLHNENTTSQKINQIQENDRNIIRSLFGREHIYE